MGRNEERLSAGVSAYKVEASPRSVFRLMLRIRRRFKRRCGWSVPKSVPSACCIGTHTEARGPEICLAANGAALKGVFDVAIFGLLAAANEALADLKNSNNAAILVSNGAFGDVSPEIDEYVVKSNAMGLALGNAAKNKLVGLLAQRLKNDGIYVGEVMVHGTIKGTSWGNGNSLDPAIIAEKYWELYQSRRETRADIKS